MDFENYLKEKCEWSTKGYTNYEMTFFHLEDLINGENIKLDYSFEECAKAYAKAMKMEYNEESLISFMSFLINVGFTRHILNNLQNMKYYGFSKELEEVKNNN